jgi:hypothetical protein
VNNVPNWFQNDGLKNFESQLQHLAERPCRLLQIGAYTGDASVWLYDNILYHYTDSVLVDVDTWEGSEEPVHYGLNWTSVETLYDTKTLAARNNRQIVKYKGTSDSFFKNNVEKYDFIYIDGDHTSYGVIKDAVSAYECLNVGGILAFDDYLWSADLGANKEPKMAIDAFYTIYQERIEILVNDYQIWVKKVQ